jgi:hypothetical protein
MSEERDDSTHADATAAAGVFWLNASLLAASACALGHAVQLGNGALTRSAFLWLNVAVVACGLAVLLPEWSRGRSRVEPLVALLLAGVVWQLWQFWSVYPGREQRAAWPAAERAMVAAAAAVIALGMLDLSWTRRRRAPALFVIYLLLGLAILHRTRDAHIDVQVFHREAFEALLGGTNPYGITMPNIYGPTSYYSAGLQVGDRLLMGYPYPPLSLFLTLPGHLAGDYRYALLLANVGAAALIAWTFPGRVGFLAAVGLLLTPRSLFVVEQGWTEPLVLLLFAAVIASALRAPRWLPLTLGLFFASKQYTVLAAPLVWLLIPDWPRFVRTLAIAGAVALAVTLPLAMTELRGFVDSVLLLQVRQPFRADALSYPAYMVMRHRWDIPPAWATLAGVAPALALGLWRAPRDAGGLGGAAALLFLAFFGFAKQAFANYYFFVIGILWLAAASGAGRRRGG